jgi:DNA-binding MarR family transcriptional regulator
MIADAVWKELSTQYRQGKSDSTLKALVVASVTRAFRNPDRSTLRSMALQLMDLRSAARAGKITGEAGEVEKVLSGMCIGLADAYLPKEDQALLEQVAGKVLRQVVNLADVGATNSMLQEHFGMRAQAITNHLSILKTRRLIERIGLDDGDQREKRYFPTQMGKKIIAEQGNPNELLTMPTPSQGNFGKANLANEAQIKEFNAAISKFKRTLGMFEQKSTDYVHMSKQKSTNYAHNFEVHTVLGVSKQNGFMAKNWDKSKYRNRNAGFRSINSRG